jgi:hypothetical protein
MLHNSTPDVYRPSISLVSWLRCSICHAGFFTASASQPEPCPACTGGSLRPVGLWNLRTEAAPAGMIGGVA